MVVARFRFGPFLVSPGHRSFRRDGQDVPLIARYFDLLVLLLVERHRVVTRQEIFDRVWSDVVVSDGALSQAVRTIRRSLGDDPREPRFIRTVSRHGYQFVGPEVIEEPDDGPLGTILAAVPTVETTLPPTDASTTSAAPDALEDPEPGPISAARADPMEALLDRLLKRPPYLQASDEERNEAAEQLHALGTAEALRQLDGEPGHAEARAILRDARWNVPGAGDVALLGSPKPYASIGHLLALRLRRAARHTSNRWGSAALGGTAAGVLAGSAGGVALWLVPESRAHGDVVLALAAVGGVAGAIGAGGVGAGLAAAEAVARSARALALTVCGAVGGLLAGALAHALARAVLGGMFGRDLPAIGGWVEGVVLGAAAGIGYGWATTPLPGGGLAAPHGGARVRTALLTGLSCAAAAILLTLGGRHLVGSSLDVLASAFDGSSVGLAPLARLLGEEALRPVTRTVVSAAEGLLFGAGLAFGLTHRPGETKYEVRSAERK
jgi:DNA-binding winged helix-turn-helix (wHTH) protein